MSSMTMASANKIAMHGGGTERSMRLCIASHSLSLHCKSFFVALPWLLQTSMTYSKRLEATGPDLTIAPVRLHGSLPVVRLTSPTLRLKLHEANMGLEMQ